MHSCCSVALSKTSSIRWTSLEERRLQRLSVMHKIHIKLVSEY